MKKIIGIIISVFIIAGMAQAQDTSKTILTKHVDQIKSTRQFFNLTNGEIILKDQAEVANDISLVLQPRVKNYSYAVKMVLVDDRNTAKVEAKKRFAFSVVYTDPDHGQINMGVKEVAFSKTKPIVVGFNKSDVAKFVEAGELDKSIFSDDTKYDFFQLPSFAADEDVATTLVLVKNSVKTDQSEDASADKAASVDLKVTIDGKSTIIPAGKTKLFYVKGADFKGIQVGKIFDGVVVCKRTVYKTVTPDNPLTVSEDDATFSKDEMATVLVRNESNAPFVVYGLDDQGALQSIAINNGSSARIKFPKGENCLTVVTTGNEQTKFILKEHRVVFADGTIITIKGGKKPILFAKR